MSQTKSGSQALPVSLAGIEQAALRIRKEVPQTPLAQAPRLSALTGARLYTKHENRHATGSFKERGALNRLLALSATERQQGVVAMSAGNHAQAVAFHAARLGIPALIVMPETTPFLKVGNTEALGAEVVLSGQSLYEAQDKAFAIARESGRVLVHPFDDPLVVAGQGTIGLELLEQMAELDCIMVPVGGGGLVAGIATVIKARRPGVAVIGVEPRAFPSAHQALGKSGGKKGGQKVGQQASGRAGGVTLADGIAVKSVGQVTGPIIRRLVDDVVLVEEEEIEQAVFALATHEKTVVEGAGAVGLAAVMADRERFAGRHVALVLSGGNIDSRILASILIRGLERDDRIVSLRLTIFDQPGTLGRIATILGAYGANILSVSHRRILLDVPTRGSSLDLMIETRDRDHSAEVIERLKAAGFDVERHTGIAAADFMMR